VGGVAVVVGVGGVAQVSVVAAGASAAEQGRVVAEART